MASPVGTPDPRPSMFESKKPIVAVVDYGMGNLFSIKHSCETAGLEARITHTPQDITRADAVILPGVGAFGNAMETLKHLDLVAVLRDVAASAKPFIGICLGMQLLMNESHEFGHHEGLGIVRGSVIRFDDPLDAGGKRLKVPYIGWNKIYKADRNSLNGHWKDSMLEGLSDGEFMYFVHSYYVKPEDPGLILSTSRYGNIDYCSGLHQGNVFASQFHPERSGPQGLKIYQNMAHFIRRTVRGE